MVLDIINPLGTTNLCANYAVRTKAQVDAAGVAIAAYNKTIANQARLFGAKVVDVNALMTNVAAVGRDVVLKNACRGT